MPTKRHPRAPCQPNRPPSLHERLIRDLIASDPRMCRNGFWRAHNALLAELGLDADEFPSDRPFLPDAYLFDREGARIVLFEVEISCPLTQRKADEYGWLWHCWDCEEVDWEVVLFVVDRYGHRNQLNLLDLSCRELAA